MNLITTYIKKYLTRELIVYLIAGILTTILNLVIYYACTILFNIDYRISNGIAWVIAVLFAFFTNKYFVFLSMDNNLSVISKELISFTACRIFSLAFEMFSLIFMVESIKINNSIAKVFLSFIVVIINYVFSKLFIFKSSKE
jgi:Predicted membrane protein